MGKKRKIHDSQSHETEILADPFDSSDDYSQADMHEETAYTHSEEKKLIKKQIVKEFCELIKRDQYYKTKFEQLKIYGFTENYLIWLSNSQLPEVHRNFLINMTRHEVITSFEKLCQRGFVNEAIKLITLKGPNCAKNIIKVAQDDFLDAVDKLEKLGFTKKNLSEIIGKKGQSAIDDIIELARDENISKISTLIENKDTIKNIRFVLKGKGLNVLENFHNYHDSKVAIEGEGESLRAFARDSVKEKLVNEFCELIKKDQYYKTEFEKLKKYGFTENCLIRLSNNQSPEVHRNFLINMTRHEVIASFEKLCQRGFENRAIKLITLKGPNCAKNITKVAQDDFLDAVDKLEKLGFTKINLSEIIKHKGQSAIDDIIELARDENISKISTLIENKDTIKNICFVLKGKGLNVLENFHNYHDSKVAIEGEGESLRAFAGPSVDSSIMPSFMDIQAYQELLVRSELQLDPSISFVEEERSLRASAESRDSAIMPSSGFFGGDVGLGATQNQFNSAGEMSSVHTAAAVRQPSLSPRAVNSAKQRGIGNKFRVNFRG